MPATLVARVALVLVLACGRAVAGSTPPPKPTPTAPVAQKQLEVVLLDDAGPQTIGRVTVDVRSRLRIVSVVPAQRRFLADLVARMNAKPGLPVDVPPPEGAPRFSDYSRFVPRSSPEFPTELRAYLERYYGLSLRPVH